jgi:predicted AlkP superfamily phosphohydrolase/phosphomutase
MSPRPNASSLLPLIAALLLLGVGCREAERPGRVLMVGIDGASWRVVQPMMQDGRLPHLARLAREGASGTMVSLLPLESPRLWTTIATGKLPEKHGIDSFTVEDPEHGPRLVASHDRAGHAIWNMATTAGLSVGVVNWWVTYPPEKVSGVIVSDHFLPMVVREREAYFSARTGDAAPVVYPAEWMGRIHALVKRRRQAPGDPPFGDLRIPGWVKPESITTIYRDDAHVGAAALEVARGLRPDLLMLMMKGVDPASHLLWATVEETPDRVARMPATAEERAGGAEVVRRFYQQADAVIGQLLEGYDSDDLVLVVSDHGFENSRKVKGLTGIHTSALARRAILFVRGPGVEPGTSVERARIQDVTPTILTWLGLPLGEDMDGEPLAVLKREPVEAVATWDTTPIERVETASTGADAEIMEQLEALGYFESDESGESEESSPEDAEE